MSDVKIACPKCGWEPDGHPYWQCTCGCVWNTFDTAAKCPDCGKQWTHTACIPFAGGCRAMPPHVDWYHNLDGWLEDEIKELDKELTVTDSVSSP